MRRSRTLCSIMATPCATVSRDAQKRKPGCGTMERSCMRASSAADCLQVLRACARPLRRRLIDGQAVPFAAPVRVIADQHAPAPVQAILLPRILVLAPIALGGL